MRLVRRSTDHGPVETGTSSRGRRPHRSTPIFPRRLRDHWLQGHAAEVAELSLTVGRYLQLSSTALFELELAARLHDIGKRAIPESILNKPAALSEAEWAMVRRHPEWGAEMLDDLPGLDVVAAAVHAHHERWDGGGYPSGLAAEAMPLTSRMVAVCDAYSAMTTDRPFGRARSPVEAVAELERCSGTQFDPAIVAAFIATTRAPAVA
jgi:two-component system, cell cycle response regulator